MTSDHDLPAATVGERAYRTIRADIIFGRLSPSRKLRLENARTQYGVSVSTLREILNRLAAEGFILAEGQRGFQVAPVSPEGFREVAAMRLLLECHALEKSLARGDIEWEGRVAAAYHKLSVAEARMAAGEQAFSETWKRYDREFHRELISACGSDVLMDAHAAVYDPYLRYQMVAVIYRGGVAADEHRALFESATARDAGAARAILVRHIEECVADALSRPDAPWLRPDAKEAGKRSAGPNRAVAVQRTSRQPAAARVGRVRRARTP